MLPRQPRCWVPLVAIALVAACGPASVQRRARWVEVDEERPPAVGGPEEESAGELRSVARDGDDCPDLAIPQRTLRLLEVDEAGATGRIDAFPEAAGRESFRLPIEAPTISSPFGPRRDPFRNRRRMHRGVDFAAESGTPVRATASGRALMAGWCDRGTGNCVVLEHAHGWRSQYFHLSEVHIRAGQWVEQGALIGDVGSTGRSTGPHLHFQLGRDGQAVDPMTLMDAPLDQ